MILQSPINSLGYGIAGYNIAKQLTKRFSSEELSIYPIGQPEEDLYENLRDYDWRISNRDEQYLDSANTLKIWHQNGLHEFVGNGTKIGFPIFELNKFTNEEIRSMKHCDQLFVCSHWAKDIVDEHVGFTNTKVVPLGVDREIFNEKNNISRQATVFFNCGKWEIRKGHNVLRTIFDNAFSQDDNVELWLLCENPFINKINDDWINYYKNSKLSNKIRIVPRQKTHRDVYNIMRQVDCGVFPVRAEGWNLELLELLSCGKHVITTDYSGHTEFIDRNNAKIIEIDKLEPAEDGIWFHRQGEWAAIENRQIDQAVEHMRYIHKLKQENGPQINLSGIETASKFSWENTLERIINE